MGDKKSGVYSISLSKCIFGAFAVVATAGVSTSAWADHKAIAHSGTTVRANASDTSAAIGTYKVRATVTIADAPENGWYRVIFPSPVKGFTEGWIHADAIEGALPVASPTRASSAPNQAAGGQQRRTQTAQRATVRPPGKNKLGLILDIFNLNPTKTQASLGEKKEPILATGFALEYNHRFSETWDGFIGLGYYSFTRKSSVSSVAEAYSAKGYGLSVGGDYFFVHKPGFDLGAGLGLGFFLSEAGNAAPNAAGTVIQESTTGITSTTYFLRLLADKSFGSSRFGMRFELGYHALTLSKVPVSPNGTANTTDTADFALSGLYAGLGLNYLF